MISIICLGTDQVAAHRSAAEAVAAERIYLGLVTLPPSIRCKTFCCD